MKSTLNNQPSGCPVEEERRSPRMTVDVRRYQKPDGWLSRYWAVYVDGELLAVVLYRKGAAAIAEALLRV